MGTARHVGLIAALFLLLESCGSGTRPDPGSTKTTSLALICAHAKQVSGYSQPVASADVLIDHAVEQIAAPCTLHLRNGAQLVIRYSRIASQTLLITDDPRPYPMEPGVTGAPGCSTCPVLPTVSATPMPTPVDGSTVTIDHSSLSGGVRSGFAVGLREPHVSLTVRDSVFNYPRGFEARIGPCCGPQGPRPTSYSKVLVSGTTIQTTDQKLAIITIVADGAGGSASFIDDRFDLPPQHWPLVGGDTCSAQGVPGVSAKCQSGPPPTVVHVLTSSTP